MELFVEVLELFQGFADDLLMADFLHAQFVEIRYAEVQEALTGHVVVEEVLRVREDRVVHAFNNNKNIHQFFSTRSTHSKAKNAFSFNTLHTYIFLARVE